MATIGSTALTAYDWARSRDPNGNTAPVIELLSQTNEILKDMMWIEANGGIAHKTTVRTGLPTSTWRLYNSGVQPSKGTVAQISDPIGNLEAQSRIDRDLLRLNGNSANWRLGQVAAEIEAMGQTMASTIFYGNARNNPERFHGLAPRYNTVSENTAATGANVIDAGGTGSSNTSMWLVCWSDRTCAGLFPKGMAGGLQHEDMGTQQSIDSNGGYYWTEVDHFKWAMGLTVPDWRYVVRVANIDVTQLNTTNAANLISLVVRAYNRTPTQATSAGPVQTSDAPSIQGSMGRWAWYCNRTVREFLDLQALNKTNLLLSMGQAYGETVTMLRGVPIRTCDAILSTETRVV